MAIPSSSQYFCRIFSWRMEIETNQMELTVAGVVSRPKSHTRGF